MNQEITVKVLKVNIYVQKIEEKLDEQRSD